MLLPLLEFLPPSLPETMATSPATTVLPRLPALLQSLLQQAVMPDGAVVILVLVVGCSLDCSFCLIYAQVEQLTLDLYAQ